MGLKTQVAVIIIAILAGLYFAGLFSSEPPPLTPGEGWWAKTEKTKTVLVPSIREFQIEFSEEGLLDLKERISDTRWFESLEGTDISYGIRADFMKKVAAYWKDKYDWRKHERLLNQFDHFKTNIEGIVIHFVHVKPKNVPQGIKPKPLLMVHGWPGSFYEFYRILPMLTDPTNHGADPEDTFEVICPSLPGFGFSEAAHRPGLGGDDMGRILHILMTQRLHFDKYFIQGGDWGALIVDMMALYFPEHILGHHNNMMSYQPPYAPFLMLVGSVISPSMIFSDEVDQKKVFPAMSFLSTMLEETGYLHLQSTKPDTIGHALTDSPVGLAAYMLEKFTAWSKENGTWVPDGSLSNFDMDHLLTNIMIYWISGSMTSAMRLYKEQIKEILIERKFDKYKSYVPLGVACFPGEVMAAMPKSWLSHKYKNIVSYTNMPRGGHFAALEEPELLAKDIRQFVRKVEAAKAREK